MDDLLLVFHGLMKLMLVVGVMVLVATAPQSAVASGVHAAGMSAQAQAGGTRRLSDHTTFDADDPLDGATDSGWEERRVSKDSIWSTTSDRDPFEQDFNIDGTPMCGAVDINGNAWGITETHFDDWCCSDTSSSMFD
jgi:hypothetical protein